MRLVQGWLPPPRLCTTSRIGGIGVEKGIATLAMPLDADAARTEAPEVVPNAVANKARLVTRTTRAPLLACRRTGRCDPRAERRDCEGPDLEPIMTPPLR